MPLPYPGFARLRSIFVLFLTALTLTMPLSALPVYFGTYGPAIQLADLDPATGALSGLRVAAALSNPSFLTKSADGRFLYAVAEGRPGGLFAFAIEADGTLTALNQAPSEGGGPCDIALSPDGTKVAVANYGGGSAIIYRVRADGALGDKLAFFKHSHFTDVFPGRQKNAHAHGVTWSPDGRLLFVPDLGGDRVYLYAYDAASDSMAVNPAQAWLEMAPGAGPRHAQFSPDGRHFYVINELDNTVSAAAYDAAAGTVTLIESVSTLPPEGYDGPTKTAELALTPDGLTLYASNRGFETLAIFRRDPASGRLSPRGHVAVPAHPRHFALSPDARWVLSAGMEGNRVAVLAIDPATGALTPTEHGLDLKSPVCVRF